VGSSSKDMGSLRSVEGGLKVCLTMLTGKGDAVLTFNLKPLLVSFLLLAFTPPIFVLRAHASSEDVATSAVSQAEQALASAYEAVLEAEQAGADVSDLLVRLSEAGDLLAQAHVSNRLGDFDGAARFADLCSQIGEEVRVEARGLRGLALEEAVQRFRWTMIGSILGVAIVVGASFLGWRIFKLRYCRRVLGMRPEVVSGES